MRVSFRSMHSGRHAQFRQQLVDDRSPFTWLRLPEQPHCRIPRAVVTAPHPAPVRVGIEQCPNGSAESAREMSDHGVDADHQIEIRDQCSGLGHGGILGQDRRTSLKQPGGGRAAPRRAALQANTVERQPPERPQQRRRQRALAAPVSALPDQSDAQPRAGAARRLRLVGRCHGRRQIGDRSRQIVEPDAQGMRQFHRLDRHFGVGEGSAERIERRNAVDPAQQRQQRRLSFDRNAPRPRRQLRHKSDELQRVAEPVITVYQHVAAVHRSAVPYPAQMVRRSGAGLAGPLPHDRIADRPGPLEIAVEHRLAPWV